MKLISNNPDLPIVGEVWIFVDSRIFGGIESHILELAKGILAFGHAVRIVLPTEYTPQAQLVEKAQAANIPTSYLPQISGVPSNTIAIKHLTSAVAHHQPSVLHTHATRRAYWLAPPNCSLALFRVWFQLIMPVNRHRANCGFTTGWTDAQATSRITALQ